MSDVEICELGSSKVVEGVALWQGTIPVAENDNDDIESLGESESFQALGLTSLPFPKDDDGHAEAVFIRDVGGRKGVYVGARDTRTAKIVGKMEPGDTVVHSTGPKQAAQLQLKEKKMQAALVSKDKRGKTMMVMIDGENGKLQINAMGAMFEIDIDGDISLTAKGGANILLQGGDCYINANLHLPGMAPGTVLMAGPPVGTAAGTTVSSPIALVPVLGVGSV